MQCYEKNTFLQTLKSLSKVNIFKFDINFIELIKYVECLYNGNVFNNTHFLKVKKWLLFIANTYRIKILYFKYFVENIYIYIYLYILENPNNYVMIDFYSNVITDY